MQNMKEINTNKHLFPFYPFYLIHPVHFTYFFVPLLIPFLSFLFLSASHSFPLSSLPINLPFLSFPFHFLSFPFLRLQHRSLSLLQPERSQPPQEHLLQQRHLLRARPPLSAASLHPHWAAPPSDPHQARETSSSLCCGHLVQQILQVDRLTHSCTSEETHLPLHVLSLADVMARHVRTPWRR